MTDRALPPTSAAVSSLPNSSGREALRSWPAPTATLLDTFDDLVANEETYGALTYRLAMIGETSRKLPDAIEQQHPDLPWPEMATFQVTKTVHMV